MSQQQNLKKFIRQGKQAREMNEADPNSRGRTDKAGKATHSQNTDSSDKTLSNYIDMVNQLAIEDQKMSDSQYPGLELYKIYEKLGEGAFSTVHKALNIRTNELVAIKIIKKQQLDNNQRRAVSKEVFIMKQLNHESIVKFIEFIEVEKYYYIVQELVQGGEIFNEIVKFTYFSEDLSRHVIKQVGEAVRYLHEEVGVVHRDIKPENLLFEPIALVPSPVRKLRKSDDPNKKDEGVFKNGVGGGGIGIVKLADFGLSKQIWRDGTKTPCGTVGYTAPEIVRDQQYSKEVDMWALGCVLYTLLCGFPPFYDEKIDQLTEKVAKGEYKFLQPWWDEISIGAKSCVKNLLTLDPKKRYTIREFLNDPWLNELQFKKPHRVVLSDFRRAEPIYSPVARVMKDAFDISNEIQRIGEESLIQKRHRNGFHEILEEEPDHHHHTQIETIEGQPVKQVQFAAQEPRTFRQEPPPQNHMQETNKIPFELKLDTSTIINRRKKQLET